MIEVYESLDGVLHGDGRLEGILYGLTRDGPLAVDSDVLAIFLVDLQDLQEQAEHSVEAMEAVIDAVDESEGYGASSDCVTIQKRKANSWRKITANV